MSRGRKARRTRKPNEQKKKSIDQDTKVGRVKITNFDGRREENSDTYLTGPSTWHLRV